MSADSIGYLDPDNRWSRLQLTRDRELAALRTVAVALAAVVASAVVLCSVAASKRR